MKNCLDTGLISPRARKWTPTLSICSQSVSQILYRSLALPLVARSVSYQFRFYAIYVLQLMK